MKIRIFQIDHDKDSEKVAYMPLEYVQKHGDVNPAIYHQIYGGTIKCNNLDCLFDICNSGQNPPGYYGESMSVSNVVEICDGKDKGFYYCDSFGFKLIDFDISQTDHSEMLKILVVEPEENPYPAEIQNNIHAMQSVVGGLIEPIYFDPDYNALAWCNEEFLLDDSKPNRQVNNVFVYGVFYIAGNREDEDGAWESCSLTEEQIKKYINIFSL